MNRFTPNAVNRSKPFDRINISYRDIEKMSGAKLWPTDALMIVAANAGEENRGAMDIVVSGNCRGCGRKIAVDSRSIRVMWNHTARNGRPVKYFCIKCAVQHDVNSIDELRDNRAPWQS